PSARGGTHAPGAGVGDDQTGSGRLLVAREHVLQVGAFAADPTRAVPDTRRRIRRLDEDAIAQLFVDVVALHHALPGVEVAVEDGEHPAAWMDAQVPADLAARVGQALAHEKSGPVHAAGGDHDGLRAHLEPSV